MYLVGLLFYIGIPSAAAYVDTSRAFIAKSFELSPEITVLICIAYFYPLLVFLASMVLKKSKNSNITYFRSQVTLASTLAVSFGLIGTFIGLSQMIARIAVGMGGGGDFTDKMASLLAAIGGALDSMSLAFLTSILGVGGSVAILFSANFLTSYFKEETDKENSNGNLDFGTDAEQFAHVVQNSVQQCLDLVADKEKVWSDLHILLEQKANSPVVEKFNEIMFKNNTLIMDMTDVLKRMQQEQMTNNEKIHGYLQNHSDRVVTGFDNMYSVVDTMSNKVEQMESSLSQSALHTSDIIEHTTKELNSVASILTGIRQEIAGPLEDVLKQALKDKNFTLTFQSINNQEQELVGVEVYICWEDDIRGRISNFELFEIANKEGLSSELDLWVMQTAIKQLAAWRSNGQWNDDWRMSINITKERILCPNFIIDLDRIIRDSGVPPYTIALEISDSTIISQPDECRDKIRQASELGVNVFIDGFGTGYSSLINLEDFKVDALKFDRNIIRKLLESDTYGLSIIETIMVVAKKMNIDVYAEGVEIKPDMVKLADIGCLYFQGYLFSKPLTSAEFEDKYMNKIETKSLISNVD